MFDFDADSNVVPLELGHVHPKATVYRKKELPWPRALRMVHNSSGTAKLSVCRKAAWNQQCVQNSRLRVLKIKGNWASRDDTIEINFVYCGACSYKVVNQTDLIFRLGKMLERKETEAK